MSVTTRCPWAEASAAEQAYHDTEWGVPVHDDRLLFEFLILEGAQAGLNWSTILRKRSHYREVFDGFAPATVAGYSREKVERLLGDPGIVRHRLKIESAVSNARAFVGIQQEFGSFDRYLWGFVDGTPLQNAWHRAEEVPVSTPLSDRFSRVLKARGFRFVGPTICYAYLQAVGVVNDHLTGCFRRPEVASLA